MSTTEHLRRALAALIVLLALKASIASSAEKNGAGAPILRFSHTHGFHTEPFAVSISLLRGDGKIYYTTNGVAPTIESGKSYNEPIKVASTTILRAALFETGLRTSPVETQTYLFLRDVLPQTGAGFPTNWGTKKDKAVPADYAMDPKIVNHPDYRGVMERALKSIPTLSLVMEPNDLFGEYGIYSHAEETGADWERPASAELIYADNREGFDINCGIRIQGGWNRRPEESPKHAFRLVFKKRYGAATLKFPLFGTSGVQEFETIVLRAGNNNSWLHWSGEERRRADFIRDQWMRDTVRAMGHPSARGFFAHLYLNGLYWGLYNVCERPSAPFLAAHFGGTATDYDSMNADKVLEGDKVAWNKMFALANGGLADEKGFTALQELLDLPSFIDFMIANLYGANADWDHSSNWYAGRRRDPPGKFQFFIWDGERTLEKIEDNTINFDDDQSPARLFQKLRANEQFRAQFAERARRHLSDGGVLSPGTAAQRFRMWATNIEDAVIAESARWGDYRRDVHSYKTGPYELYTRDDHWRPEIERLVNQYFPNRTTVVLKQFRAAGLYP